MRILKNSVGYPVNVFCTSQWFLQCSLLQTDKIFTVQSKITFIVLLPLFTMVLCLVLLPLISLRCFWELGSCTSIVSLSAYRTMWSTTFCSTYSVMLYFAKLRSGLQSLMELKTMNLTETSSSVSFISGLRRSRFWILVQHSVVPWKGRTVSCVIVWTISSVSSILWHRYFTLKYSSLLTLMQKHLPATFDSVV